MSSEEKNRSEENYERLLFAIAVYFAADIGIDIKEQVEYKDLSPAQKTFASKIYDKKPELKEHVESEKRITEEQIVKDVASVAKDNKDDLVKIVTVGDAKVCEKCKKYQNVIVSQSGKDTNYPSLDKAIKDGFLHYGCRCSLQHLDVDEIPLKSKINPRYQTRKAARPDLYNSTPLTLLVFN